MAGSLDTRGLIWGMSVKIAEFVKVPGHLFVADLQLFHVVDNHDAGSSKWFPSILGQVSLVTPPLVGRHVELTFPIQAHHGFGFLTSTTAVLLIGPEVTPAVR